MRKKFIILAIIGILGQIVSLYAFFVSKNNDQVILTHIMFIAFSLVGVGSLFINDYLQKKSTK